MGEVGGGGGVIHVSVLVLCNRMRELKGER